jgi:hypothetical protein
VLTEGEAGAMREWVIAADGWSHSAQRFVGAATELATVSRGIAERIDGPSSASHADRGRGPPLSDQLRELAEIVEDDTRELRDRYLATAASIEEYADVLG